MQIPVAKKIEKKIEKHGDIRVDPYYWLNDRENPEVIQYLEDENAYTQQVMKPVEELQEQLFKEITGRIKEDDNSVPYFRKGYWYYIRYEAGKEYPVYCRKAGSQENPEEILLNLNELSEGHDYYNVGGLTISPDNKLLAYAEDTVGRRIYTVKVKNLVSEENLDFQLEGGSGSIAWANDNATLFYGERDLQTLRSHKIKSFNIETEKTSLKYEELDETFYCSVDKSKSEKYLIISSGSTLTSEYRCLSADEPSEEFKIFQSRIRGMEYDISHFEDKWYILTNWEAQNFRLMISPEHETSRENWREIIAHRSETLVEGVEIFKNYLVIEERTSGLNRLRVTSHNGELDYYIPFQEETYNCWTSTNPEFDSEILRFGYTSLTVPSSVFDFNMASREQKLLKQQEVVGGYDSDAYEAKRIQVKARDGKSVPVSLVYRKSLKKEGNPLLLYGYGSYGHSMDAYFSSTRLSLLDRGFIFAIAHIRGGEDLGRAWYEDGKLLNKKNTFFDFIDCAEELIRLGYTSPGMLYGMGGSAGGLLIGAVINERPDLWKGVIAAVPFVDVVTTMLDDTIPLTTGEYDEWGDPSDEKYYHYIKSYSPYDNVKPLEYPNMLVTTGLHDSQVQYWEPAKWVAKLRDVKKGDQLLLLHTNMDSGHSGASGRYAVHKETALEYAFLLMLEDRL